MGVEVLDLVRFQRGFVAGHAHALQRGQPCGVRLGQVMAIGGDAIAGQRGEDFRAAGHGMGAALQHQHRRALAQGKPVAMDVKRLGQRAAESFQGIESRINHLAQRIITTGDHHPAAAAADQVIGMAQRVGPGGAGIGNHRGGCGQGKGAG